MSMVKLVIDDKPVTISGNATILEAASENGIRIPTLCMLKTLDPKANCRLCIVEAAGMRTFAPACATRAEAGMVVHTDSARIRQSRKTTLELLLSRHAVDCHHCLRIGNSRCADLDPVFCEMCFFCDCVRDGFCELQALAREYGVDALPYESEPVQWETDESTGTVIRNPNKCINCRRCVDICTKVQTVGALSVVNRGAQTLVAAAAANLKESSCVQCGRCIDNCPTGALSAREKIDEVIYQAHQCDAITVAQISADIAGRLAELSGMKMAELNLHAVAGGLRKIGVDYVMFENYALAQTLNDAKKKIADALSAGDPIIVTTNHSAEKFVHNNYPDLANQMIRCNSAQQQFGGLIHGDWATVHQLNRFDIFSISITQTHANAIEAAETGSVNYVLDANELYRIFLRTGVNLRKIPPSEFDCLGEAPEVDARLRALLIPNEWEPVGAPREFSIQLNGKTIKAIGCNNLGQARAVLNAAARREIKATVIGLFA